MASNTVRMFGGAASAAVLAVLVVALLPRPVPTENQAQPVAATQTPVLALPPTPTISKTGPTVDTFLLGNDGVAVVAGHATPGKSVSILLDGVEVAQAQADVGGGFAATAQIAASEQPRMLTFAVEGEEAAGETVLVRPQIAAVSEVAPPAPDDHVPSVDEVAADIAAPETVPDTAAPDVAAPVVRADIPAKALPNNADMSDSGPAAEQAAGNAAAGPDAAMIAAPTIVVDDTGARVLSRGPLVMDRVALDAITYDNTGAVQLAGRAPGDGAVRVYVNNRPLTGGPVNAEGDWRLTLPQVDAGTYTLRIDEIAADGSVASRIETPFRREDPVDVAALQKDGTGVRVATNTVQPGSTLWAIARDNLGEGIMYVAVFEANRDQIRDPDLIYPGQVFVIPEQ